MGEGVDGGEGKERQTSSGERERKSRRVWGKERESRRRERISYIRGGYRKIGGRYRLGESEERDPTHNNSATIIYSIYLKSLRTRWRRRSRHTAESIIPALKG